VALLLRERLTGEAPPKGTQAGLDLVRDWIEKAGGADMDALGLVLDDQSAFATLATKLLEDLALIEGEPAADDDPDDSEDDGEDDSDGEDDATDEDDGGEGQVDQRGEQQSGDDSEGEGESEGEELSDDDQAEGGDGEQEGMLPVRPNRPPAELTPGFDYKAWTTEFDEVIAADELCDPDELVRLRTYLDQQLLSLRAPSQSSPTACSAA
jgi:cobaltochelatase CobT